MTPELPAPDAKPQTPDPGATDAWLAPRRFALVLAALLAVTFWRVLFGGEAFFYRDYGFLGYPFAHFHRERFWSGDFFPLWNPYVNCGAPFLAQWNTLCLYPGALIYLLLPLPWSLGFFCVAHLFLGGMGMRALAERWTGSRFGAAVAGVAFVFSGLVLGCIIYPNYLVALGWMPWVALATRRAWQEGGRSLVLAALAGAMQMLSGAPEIILLTWAFLAALAAMDVGVRRKTENVSRSLLTHYALRFTSVIALITGLCAAQLLPFFQLLSLSQRSGDAVNTFWSLPGWGWVNLFFPLFMNFQTEQGVFVMIGQSFFPSVYLGIVPLTLALLAVWRIGLRGVGCPPFRVSGDGDTLKRGHQTDGVWEVRLLAGATLLAVLLAMGDNFVLWRWLREVLPLGIVRFPVKALLLVAFTVPLLAAWGVELLLNGKWASANSSGQIFSADEVSQPKKQRLQLAGAARHFAIGWTFPLILALVHTRFWNLPMLSLGFTHVHAPQDPWWRIGVGILAWFALVAAAMAHRSFNQFVCFLCVAACVLVDGAFRQGIFNPTIPASAFDPGLAATYHASKGALTAAPKLGEGRIMLSPRAELLLHYREVPKFYDDFIGQRLAFWGNLNLLDGLPKVNGASTLVTREWNDVEYFLYGTTNPAPANLMDFLGVTHTTKPGELMQWERRETAMPLVSAGQRVQAHDTGSQSVGALFAPGWNPREIVWLPTDTAARWGEAPAEPERAALPPNANIHSPPPPARQEPRPTNAPVQVRLMESRAGTMEVATEAAGPTTLVLAHTFYPSWRATVNGQPAPVLRANHAFQAIPIPAGKSTIRLDYVDWPFRIGAGISALTLLGCAFFWQHRRAS